jgi:periplasmic divalent cation tolerance protein
LRRLAQVEQNDKLVLVYSTFPDLASAERVAAELVKARLAACVNIIPGMVSVYEWEGQLHRGTEVVAIIKTRQSLAGSVMTRVTAGHSYDTPALLVLPVADGGAAYVDWLLRQTASA